MAIAKIEGASPEEIRTIKNNPLEPIKLNWDTEPVINFLEPEKFYEHYQNLAPTKEEQKQWLAQLNTRLCRHCLIPSNFKYCDNCDLIYNPPPCMIYTIPEKEGPINSCTSKSESPFNPDSNSNNDDDENNSSSFEQELKWFSDNNKSIMPECVHNTDAGFDLKYSVLPDEIRDIV
ncbi:hypothetical protein G9A89_022561 [Geosiphon pyriformis]|nr:hypothetical protein G9A89_022561 [Geosiphon pyriformis]